MNYQGILFDLDGTLLDTLGDLTAAVNAALSAHGFPLRSQDEVRRFVGNGIGNLIARAVPDGTDADTVAACLATFRGYYAEHINVYTKPYDGILPLLTDLAAAGVRVGVVSNKIDFAAKALCAAHFGELIPVVVGECEGLRRKPYPDTVNKALTELGLTAADCVYVGDSDVDIQTAANAGMTGISVDWGFRPRESLLAAGATVVCSTADALRRELL